MITYGPTVLTEIGKTNETRTEGRSGIGTRQAVDRSWSASTTNINFHLVNNKCFSVPRCRVTMNQAAPNRGSTWRLLAVLLVALKANWHLFCEPWPRHTTILTDVRACVCVCVCVCVDGALSSISFVFCGFYKHMHVDLFIPIPT